MKPAIAAVKKTGSRAWRSWRRGQAMVEYSSVVFVLALGTGGSIITVLPMLMNALNRYLHGIYFMLNMAVP